MAAIAKGLRPEDIDAIARYYAGLTPPRPAPLNLVQPARPHLLAAGSLHRLQDRARRDVLMQQVLAKAPRKGANSRRADDGARLLAAEWALEDRPGVDDIVEYETRLNYVLPKYDDAVC